MKQIEIDNKFYSISMQWMLSKYDFAYDFANSGRKFNDIIFTCIQRITSPYVRRIYSQRAQSVSYSTQMAASILKYPNFGPI